MIEDEDDNPPEDIELSDLPEIELDDILDAYEITDRFYSGEVNWDLHTRRSF